MTVEIERDERGRAMSLHCTACGVRAAHPSEPVDFDPRMIPEWIWDAGFRLSFSNIMPYWIHACPPRPEREEVEAP